MPKVNRDDVEKYIREISSPKIFSLYTLIQLVYISIPHNKESEEFQIMCGLVDVFYRRVEQLNGDKRPEG
jgi:hypothetical protein